MGEKAKIIGRQLWLPPQTIAKLYALSRHSLQRYVYSLMYEGFEQGFVMLRYS